MKTLTQLQQKIHRKYAGDVDYPSSTEEDWTLRTGLLNDAVDEWFLEAGKNGTRWRELFVDLADASDGDKTTDGTGEYDMPTDFVFISSLVKIGDSYYDYLPPDKVMAQTDKDSTKRYFYITGNGSTGHTLHINPSSDTGATIAYSYYKKPTALSEATDVIEIGNPDYAVFKTLARLHENDFRNDLVTFYEDRAKETMEAMIINNEITPNYNDYTLEDLGWLRHGESFGD